MATAAARYMDSDGDIRIGAVTGDTVIDAGPGRCSRIRPHP